MADIAMEQGQHRCYFIGLTDEGKRWLRCNVIVDHERPAAVAVGKEYALEFIEEIKKDGLEIEVK